MSTAGQRLIRSAKEARTKINFEFENKIEAYCKSERQWPRWMRIQHAEYRKKLARSDEDRRFWNAVLKRMRD